MSRRIACAGESMGYASTYDFQRWGRAASQVNAAFREARQFAVGVYSQGARLPESLVEALYKLPGLDQ